MYWSHGTWCIGDEKQLQGQLESDQPSKHTGCVAFIESAATHPTAMSAEVVWKGTARGYNRSKDNEKFEIIEGVSVATGTVRATF